MRRSAAVRRRGWWMLLLAGAALEHGPAVASELPALGDELHYRVPTDCPTRRQWHDALQARLPEQLRAKSEHSFSVEIERERGPSALEARYAGRLGSRGAAASEARTLNGASCEEVAAALTLIAALELQQDGPGIERAPTEQTPEAAAPGVDTPSLTDAERSPDRLRIGVTAFALLQSLASPRLTTDLGVGLTASWRTRELQPWLLFGVYWGEDERRVADSTSSARFDRWSTYFVGCPLRFPRNSAAALRPCLNADVGRLKGTGRGVDLAQQSAALLASVGADLRFEWVFVERIALAAGVGGVLTLSRPRFFFSPEFTALEVSPLGLRAGGSASVSF